ncbi:39S ribosomal protein L54, mitochondrial [Ischnura elegans]|uniref:39S ribosomal protein L54, mitochondrial n=1 Tax=Ischnura elegans TaxID=197161 RepID=UPI001ED89AEA|nr:39S ribosomal protein L54, mitochondrial [Ischnura elegans]
MTCLGRQFLPKFLWQSSCIFTHEATYCKKAVPAIASLGKKKKLAKLGPTVEKVVLPVESDPEKLVNFLCGSNIFKEGEPVKLKPDEEYPSWLWDIRTTKPPPLEELNPEEKYYWKRVRKMGMVRNNELKKLKKF